MTTVDLDYWPYLFGAEALRQNAIDLAIDEDQLENAERIHTTEQVMGIVFEHLFSFQDEDIVALGNTELVATGGEALPNGEPSTTTSANLIQPGFNSVMPQTGTSTEGGDFEVFSDGTFTYTPRVGFTGPDSFDYRVCGGNCDPATFEVEVSGLVWYVDSQTKAAKTVTGGAGDP